MLSDLLSIFISEVFATRFLREVRWSGGVRCIYCGSLYVWGWYRGVYRRYRCKSCLRTFNDKSGTDFEYSRIPLNEGLFIMYLSGCLNVPLLRASIDVGRSYGSVYRSFRKIVYSVDEVYVNAGLKGRGNHGRIILLGRRPLGLWGLKVGRGVPVSTIIGRKRRDVGE